MILMSYLFTPSLLLLWIQRMSLPSLPLVNKHCGIREQINQNLKCYQRDHSTCL